MFLLREVIYTWVSQHTWSIISIFSNLRVMGFMHGATEFAVNSFKVIEIVCEDEYREYLIRRKKAS
jgi:hypothetical protein